MTSENGTKDRVVEPGREFMASVWRRRDREKKEWDAYWKYRRTEAEGTVFPKFQYFMARFVDAPVSWFRENIVEPLHDKHKMPYYHRKINRVPEIDQCGVNDQVCLYEAEEQFRLDKMIDYYIKDILFKRAEQCVYYYGKDKAHHCVQQLEDYEMADLNFFIKYGELGSEQTVVACYTKQKTRLIWERRHPEIMEERKRAYEEHLERMRQGKFDLEFWKKGHSWKKRDHPPGSFYGINYKSDVMPMYGDHAISKDWRYYRKLEDDPEFDTVNYPKKWNEIAKRDKEERDRQKQAQQNGEANGANGDGKQ